MQADLFNQAQEPMPKFGGDIDHHHKREGHTNSEKAAKSLKPVLTYLEQRVFETIRSFGPEGCISDEICAVMSDVRMNTVTPRYAKLKEKGFIEDTGHSRKPEGTNRNQTVMRAVK